MRDAVTAPSAAWLVALAAYVALVITAAVVGSFWPEPPHLIALLNELALLTFVPAPFLVIPAVILRSRAAIALGIVPLALFLWLYGSRFIPIPAVNAGPDEREIIVYTANIAEQGGSFGPLLDQIAHEAADLVFTQELAPIGNELDVALRRLGYQAALEPRSDYTGVGLWSRYPIVDAESMRLAGQRGNFSQRIRIDVAGTIVTVFNVHLNAPVDLQWRPTGNPLDYRLIYQRRHRADQVEALLAQVRAQDGPVLLAGDFNLTDRTYEYRRLSEELTDSFASTGWGLGGTFPAPGSDWRFARLSVPLVRIDYIWAGKDVSPRSAHPVEAAGSDHLGLVSRLALRRTG